ncbi:MAG: glycosyltransferase family 2 protein [Planctomycetota bacterium]|jgi:glycosyltransferase involved in cell wall biosynthesis
MVCSTSIWIVIPAYNEAKILGNVLGELLDCNPSYQIVVVDDGSHDNTAAIAGSFDVHVLTHPVNLGQGAALVTGIEYSLREKADIIVTFDADGQMNPQDIDVLVNEVLKGGVDIALGSRFLTAAPENMSGLKRIILKLATQSTKLSTRLKVTDTHNGIRAFKAGALRKIVITQNRMAHASEILSEVARNKLVYREVPVTIRYTQYSKVKGQPILNAINILFELFTKGHK